MRATLAVSLCALALMTVGRPAPAEIAIGFANPLSGPLAEAGADNLRAVTAAVDRLNAAGGVLGEPLRLVAVDDRCGIEPAIRVADELVAAEVVMVVGHYCSHSSLVAAAVYDMAGVLMITPDSTHPRLTEEGRPNVFRLIGRDDDQSDAAAELIAGQWPDRRIAVIHDGTIYGRNLAVGVRQSLGRRDIGLALFAEYAPDRADYASLVDRLHTAEAELLYIAGYGPDAGRIARQARAAGLRLQLMGGDAIEMRAFWQLAQAAGDETVFTAPRPLGSRAASADERVSGQAVPTAVDRDSLRAYAAVQLWAQAASRAASLETVSVARMLRRGRFATAWGEVAFDEMGDLAGESWAWQVWRKGEIRPLE